MKRLHLHLFVLAFCLAGYGWLAWVSVADPAAGSTPTLCVFRNATGIPCPSCGATRSLELLMRGDVADAAGLNPVGLLLGLALLSFPLWILADTVRRRDTFHRFYRTIDRAFSANRALAIAGAVLVAANWWWNIIKGL